MICAVRRSDGRRIVWVVGINGSLMHSSQLISSHNLCACGCEPRVCVFVISDVGKWQPMPNGWRTMMIYGVSFSLSVHLNHCNGRIHDHLASLGLPSSSSSSSSSHNGFSFIFFCHRHLYIGRHHFDRSRTAQHSSTLLIWQSYGMDLTVSSSSLWMSITQRTMGQSNSSNSYASTKMKWWPTFDSVQCASDRRKLCQNKLFGEMKPFYTSSSRDAIETNFECFWTLGPCHPRLGQSWSTLTWSF